MGNSNNSASSTSKKENIRRKLKKLHKMDLNELLKNMVEGHSEITKDYWVKSPPIGRSDIGEVREVVHKRFGTKRILKVLYLNMFNSKEIELILNEISIAQRLKNPNILEMFAFNYDAQNIYIIMEFFQGRAIALVRHRYNLIISQAMNLIELKSDRFRVLRSCLKE